MKVLEWRPVHTYPVIFENEEPRLSLPSTGKRLFDASKKAGSFENGSPEKIFENAGLSFSLGRRKTEVFEYDDVLHHTAYAL